MGWGVARSAAARAVAYGLFFIAMTTSWLPITAHAQFSDVIERCRTTVGRPIVQSCMASRRGAMGNRETALEECRTQARPAVFRCVAEASGRGGAAAPREAVRTDPRHEAPRVAAKPATDGPRHASNRHPPEAPAAPQTATAATPQITTPVLPAGATSALFGRRVALLIGNGGYEHVP